MAACCTCAPRGRCGSVIPYPLLAMGYLLFLWLRGRPRRPFSGTDKRLFAWAALTPLLTNSLFPMGHGRSRDVFDDGTARPRYHRDVAAGSGVRPTFRRVRCHAFGGRPREVRVARGEAP